MIEGKERRFVDDRLDAMRHSPHICFAEAVRSANRAVNRRYAERIAGVGVAVGQASILMRLYYLEEVTMAVLAEQMETDRTTMVRNVAALQRSGHIASSQPEGARALVYRLTDKGFEDLQVTLPHWQAAQDDLRAALGDELWTMLMGGMRRIVELDGMACSRGAISH